MDDCIQFSAELMLAKLRCCQGKNGIMITNPPYGERIGEEEEIQKLSTADLGKLFDRIIRTGRFFMVTTDKEAEEKSHGA